MVSQKNLRSIIVAALVFIVVALCFYWLERNYRWNSRADYSGNGIYDLSKFKPYFFSSNNDGMSEVNLEPVFSTNSTEISIKNKEAQPINISLFIVDDVTEKSVLIGEMKVLSHRSGKFTNLSSDVKYQISFSASENYAVLVSD